MMCCKFILHFSIRIVVFFIFFTIVGTVSHELGHIAVAKSLGYDTELHYGSMRHYNAALESDPSFLEFAKIQEENLDSLKSGVNFKLRGRYNELVKLIGNKYPKKDESDAFWITLGGPAQTILTSFLGLFILLYRRSKSKSHFVLLDWLGVFLSLFALRYIFNFFTGVYASVFYGKKNFHGDEFRLSRYLEMDEWFLPIITMILGILICSYVIFKVIPLKYRFTFIISGLMGGILGFAIWFGFLGPIILPR